MKLHLFGASGTGVITLGQALEFALGLSYFDTDGYFWEPSDLPFAVRQARYPASLRDLARHQSWLVGGSIVGWGAQQLVAFDLVVFLWRPPALRLHQREHTRYGHRLRIDPSQAARTQAFLSQAAGYDDSSTGGTRTLATHTGWLAQFSYPVLELRGDLSVAQRLAAMQRRR